MEVYSGERPIRSKDLEEQIERARLEFLAAPTAASQHFAWQRMVDLIRQRSPQRIAAMEKAQGLR